MKNKKQITFNEFTKNLLSKGIEIVELKFKQLNNKSQLFVSVSTSKIPILFNWKKEEQRWVLVQD